MNNYVPPFTITNIMLERISSIMKKIGKLDNYKDLNRMPILRRNNRIKSIHSSLAIEANSLSFDQVKDIIDGKVVIGPKNEIQEVQNAYNAYLKIKEVNPYSLNDLKMMHGTLTYLTVKDSGNFRKGGEGVFDEDGNCIFVCPPPEQVDNLMNQLFAWMNSNKEEIHPLILSLCSISISEKPLKSTLLILAIPEMRSVANGFSFMDARDPIRLFVGFLMIFNGLCPTSLRNTLGVCTKLKNMPYVFANFSTACWKKNTA